ncbi:MAG: hypothetical protein ACMVO3_22925 [Thalassobaculum sp.]
MTSTSSASAQTIDLAAVRAKVSITDLEGAALVGISRGHFRKHFEDCQVRIGRSVRYSTRAVERKIDAGAGLADDDLAAQEAAKREALARFD